MHIVVMAGERWSQPQFVPNKRWWGSAEICTSTRCLELCSIAHFPVFFIFLIFLFFKNKFSPQRIGRILHVELEI